MFVITVDHEISSQTHVTMCYIIDRKLYMREMFIDRWIVKIYAREMFMFYSS
jgi:hypothetical protein